MQCSAQNKVCLFRDVLVDCCCMVQVEVVVGHTHYAKATDKAKKGECTKLLWPKAKEEKGGKGATCGENDGCGQRKGKKMKNEYATYESKGCRGK